jgi:hypothetical protein
MSLPALEWRKLPVRHLSVTASFSANFILENIYDVLTGSFYHDGSARVIRSGSAWSASGKFTTGSNVEAVWCRPPVNTSLSQSVIFSAKNALAPFSSATPPVVTNENPYSASVLHVACVKNASGPFTEWTSLYPFGSGSYSTGYARATNIFTSYTRIAVYESKEALCINFLNKQGNLSQAIFAGAIIDPEEANPTSSVDSETDGRLYGVISSGVSTQTPTSFGASFLSGSGEFLTHNFTLNTTTAGFPRFVTFFPRQNSILGVYTKRPNTTTYGPTYTTFSGKNVQNPIYVLSTLQTPYDYFVGRLRDVTIVKGTPTNQIMRDSSNNIKGFTLGASESSSTNAVLLNYTQ